MIRELKPLRSREIFFGDVYWQLMVFPSLFIKILVNTLLFCEVLVLFYINTSVK